MKTEEKDRAREQARAQLESILEMVAALEKADSDADGEKARETITSDPLSVEIRSVWHPVSTEAPGEYMILLCTGGPAVRIFGKLNKHDEPESASIEYQDWGTVWTDYPLDDNEEKQVLTYCEQFYFGE